MEIRNCFPEKKTWWGEEVGGRERGRERGKGTVPNAALSLEKYKPKEGQEGAGSLLSVLHLVQNTGSEKCATAVLGRDLQGH